MKSNKNCTFAFDDYCVSNRHKYFMLFNVMTDIRKSLNLVRIKTECAVPLRFRKPLRLRMPSRFRIFTREDFAIFLSS